MKNLLLLLLCLLLPPGSETVQPDAGTESANFERHEEAGYFYTALESATEGGLVPDSALTHLLDASNMPANCVEALVPYFYIVPTIDLLVTAMPNAFSPLWVEADEQILTDLGFEEEEVSMLYRCHTDSGRSDDCTRIYIDENETIGIRCCDVGACEAGYSCTRDGKIYSQPALIQRRFPTIGERNISEEFPLECKSDNHLVLAAVSSCISVQDGTKIWINGCIPPCVESRRPDLSNPWGRYVLDSADPERITINLYAHPDLIEDGLRNISALSKFGIQNNASKLGCNAISLKLQDETMRIASVGEFAVAPVTGSITEDGTVKRTVS